MMKTKLIRGKWVIRGSGSKRQPIKDGAVYIEGTEIRDVGPYESLKKKHDFDVELGADRHIVMAGLVNSHDHGKGLTFLQRGVMDGPLETWLHEFFGKVTFGEDTYQNVLLSCAKQIQNGVTSTLLNFYGPVDLMDFNNYQKDIDAGARACVDSGMRVAFAPHVYDRNRVVYMDDEFLPKFPPHLKRFFGFRVFTKEDTAERVGLYFKAMDKLYRKYNGRGDRIKIFLSAWNVHWCSDELLKEVKGHATELKTGIQIHLVETWYQGQYGPRKLGHSPVAHLDKLGFLGPEVSCAHSVWLTAKDMKIMAKTGAIAVHNPSSNLRLHSGIAAVHYMKEAGMNVAMGLDSTSINDDEDIFQEMRLCSLLHRVPGIGKTRLTSDEILDINQLGGAKATGFNGQTGSIEPGKKADIVLLRTDRLMAPYISPKLAVTDLIILRAKGADVDTVLINGDIVVENGRYLKTDIEELGRKIAEWKETSATADKNYTELLKQVTSFFKRWGLKERRYRYNNFA